MSGSAWSNQVQNQVIIAGPSGQLLVYAPTTGANNLIYSISGSAFTDPYGNQVLAGATGYGLIAGNFVAQQVFQGQTNLYDGSVLGSESGAWTAGGSIGGNLGDVALDTSVSFTTPMQFLMSDGHVTVSAPSATGTNTGFDFIPGTGLIPQVSGVDETWHSVIGDVGWSAVTNYAGIKYRFDVLGNVQFTGAAQHASITATTQINGSNPLPAAYRPASFKILAAGNSPLSRLMVEYRTDGILYAVANASAPGTIAEIDAKIPLSDT